MRDCGGLECFYTANIVLSVDTTTIQRRSMVFTSERAWKIWDQQLVLKKEQSADAPNEQDKTGLSAAAKELCMVELMTMSKVSLWHATCFCDYVQTRLHAKEQLEIGLDCLVQWKVAMFGAATHFKHTILISQRMLQYISHSSHRPNVLRKHHPTPSSSLFSSFSSPSSVKAGSFVFS